MFAFGMHETSAFQKNRTYISAIGIWFSPAGKMQAPSGESYQRMIFFWGKDYRKKSFSALFILTIFSFGLCTVSGKCFLRTRRCRKVIKAIGNKPIPS